MQNMIKVLKELRKCYIKNTENDKSIEATL